MQSLDWNRMNFALRARRGSVLLALLMGIVILMALYFLDIRTIFRPAGKTSKPGDVLPWVEEDRLVGSTQFVQLPAPPKPTLDKERKISAPVFRGGDERGRIEMVIRTDGTLAGTWNCEYTQNSVLRKMDAAFKGNIDISKTFQNSDGENPSYLYLYTKGDYSENATDQKTQQWSSSEGGLVYVTGWLRPDGSAQGTLTITTDKKWHAEYQWDNTK